MSQTSSNSKLVQGYTKAFVDSKVEADPMYYPQLLTNRGNQKVLTAIEKELKSCDDLFISVAFITMGGIAQEERELAIERLVDDDANDRLDYIFTVDIFNEGVDIPEINQVIMLRPTESPIVFVQQLGRGLRKADGKEFVIVIDFIGNYQNNYMIPIALSGDRTGNKDNIRRGLMEGNNIIKGASTIYFDEISRDRIYKSIDSAKLNNKRQLRKEYQDFKFKLGRIPKLKEYDEMGELDPLRLINTWGSYQAFLIDSDTDYQSSLSQYQLDVLEFLSRAFASGMRIQELSLLSILINSPENVELWEDTLKSVYGIRLNELTRKSVYNVLSGHFFRGKVFQIPLTEIHDGKPVLTGAFNTALTNPQFKDAVNEIIDFGKYRYSKDYSNNYQGTSFNLNKKYTYTEVCWLLNWKAEEVSLNIGGYKYDSYSKTYPIFINYEKGEDVGEEFTMPGTEGITAVKIGYKLHTPVDSNLYEYITEESL